MKKVYIATGCGGMPGEAFYKKISDRYELKCTDIDLNAHGLAYLDFREEEEYRKQVVDFKPDCLIHPGADTSLEYCEENIDDPYFTNTISYLKK